MLTKIVISSSWKLLRGVQHIDGHLQVKYWGRGRTHVTPAALTPMIGVEYSLEINVLL